jgi:hypothetical protein
MIIVLIIAAVWMVCATLFVVALCFTAKRVPSESMYAPDESNPNIEMQALTPSSTAIKDPETTEPREVPRPQPITA